MKKYHSVWMLIARSTAPRLILLLLVMCAVEACLFGLNMSSGGLIDDLLWHIHLRPFFSLIFALWTAALALPGWTAAGYTLNRLQISRCKFLICHWIYSALSYFILIGAQVLLVLALGLWYTAAVPAGSNPDLMSMGPQSMLILFYRNRLLHALLPLADWPLILRNLALLFSLGGVCAATSTGIRTDKAAVAPTVILTTIVIIFFPAFLAEVQAAGILAAVALIISVWGVSTALRPEVSV